MYSYKSIDTSFLTFQSDICKFYNALIRIKTLLYHSVHQSPEYMLWLDVAATVQNKIILKNISQQILIELFVDFNLKSINQDDMLYKNNDAFLYIYKSKAYSAQQELPTIATCDFELSKLQQTKKQLYLVLRNFKLIFEKFSIESNVDVVQNISILFNKIKIILNRSDDWGYAINKINQYVCSINELLDITYISAIQINAIEIVKALHTFARDSRAHITNMIKIKMNKCNLDSINIWCGLIDKMTTDSTKEGLIKQDLQYFLEYTELDHIIINNIDNLSAIDTQLILFMKGKDENNLVDISDLKHCKLLNRLGVIFENPPKINASHLCELGNLVLQTDVIIPHPLLACEFFELAYMYAKDDAVKSLALCQLVTGYAISQRGGYCLGFYDESHIALYRYIKYLKTFDKTEENILSEIKCQVVKFNVDVINGNLHKDVSNKNLISILYLLEEGTLILSSKLTDNLEEILGPIFAVRNEAALGKSDIECINKIRILMATKYTISHTKKCFIQ